MNPTPSVTQPVAAVYLRVSTDEQTVETQRAPLQRLCTSRGWTPRYFEDVMSGTKKSRPGFDAMLAAVHRGEVKAVVVAAIDRLGRNTLHVIETVQKIAAAGCELVSERDSWLTTTGAQRDFMLTVFAGLAKFERDLLIERTRAGLARARRQGKRLGRPRADTEHLRRALQAVSDGVDPADAARICKVSLRTLKRRLTVTA